ncbi:MAG: hypothetical protein L6R40_005238 [Gallowayella cf. fulva]|nr:MAG: hypothetical protein L6R40_005238 [Xanthomendoza cf. fulva]
MPQLQHSVRHYATEGASSGGTNKWLKYGGAFGAIFVTFGVVRAFAQKPSEEGSEEARKKLEALTGKQPGNPPDASANKTFKGGDQGWVDLKLENVEELSHNAKKFRFALPDKNDVSGLEVASALLTKYKGPEMEKPVIRPYTPTSDEDARGHIDFVIKKYPNGPMSSHLHDMEPPQRLEFKGPIPKYPWSPNKHDHICLIAGGTGITPYDPSPPLPPPFHHHQNTNPPKKNRMYQLCRAIFSNPTDKTKVTLVYGNLTESDILLKHEFENLENTYPQRFRAFYMLDQPPDNWTQGGTGYINYDLLKQVLPEPKVENVKIFVCGPPGMYKAISGVKKSPQDQGELGGVLRELGYREEQVYKF